MTTPRLLLCGFGSFPEAPLNPSAAVISALAQDGWSPDGLAVDYLTVPVQWRGSVEAILRRLDDRPADAVLVVGVAVEADGFRVETLARNLACADRPDQAGQLWERARIAAEGPDTVAATAPLEAMAADIAEAGLKVRLSEDAGDYLCNFTLYRLLLEGAAPQVGFLHVPQARECAEAAAFSLEDIRTAVCAAAQAVGEDLSRSAARPHRA